MKPTQRNALMVAITIALLIVSLFLIFPVKKSTRLGLDLEGGMYVVFQAKPAPGTPVTRDAVEQARYILQQRVDKLGVAEAQISLQGEDNIIVELPGIKDPKKALAVIDKTALLEFKPVTGTDEKGNPILGDTVMTGKYLKSAAVGFDSFGKPKVDMTFTDDGAKLFEKITGELVGKQLAIVLDGKVMSAPVVRDRISGGSAEITGDFTIDEAKELVIVLQTGALPVRLELQEKQVIGPTLGRESLRQALTAAIAGLVLVAAYLLFYYRILGVIAFLSLGSFAILFWGIIAAINRFTPQGWPLNLPAMAGVILMIGVAADSCVLIFERVREELRAGKKESVAADAGFKHSFVTILDADFVTFLVALSLAFLGIGPVRGFAVALASGIVIDLFVTYLFTQPLLSLLGRTGLFRKPALVGARKVEA